MNLTSSKLLQVCHTVVDHVFGGVLVSRVQCQQCGQISSTYDSMNDLSVEVDNGYYGVVGSVLQALTSFVEPEVMSGDNAYYCEWCKRSVPADIDWPDVCLGDLCRYYCESFVLCLALPLGVLFMPYLCFGKSFRTRSLVIVMGKYTCSYDCVVVHMRLPRVTPKPSHNVTCCLQHLPSVV